ncbi:hypothetical protein PoB_000634400 [Plakobranchus ocellatus]|uniref:Uncharacterized protein n=1 Tax=Plakobranchus ocellatus TaxID=259542 RepID=A0AAV3YCN9_9GAST|nr:hypothetical protein PoB_000634400 [Plakobranchus ocellatus]
MVELRGSEKKFRSNLPSTITCGNVPRNLRSPSTGTNYETRISSMRKGWHSGKQTRPESAGSFFRTPPPAPWPEAWPKSLRSYIDIDIDIYSNIESKPPKTLSCECGDAVTEGQPKQVAGVYTDLGDIAGKLRASEDLHWLRPRIEHYCWRSLEMVNNEQKNN